MSMFEVYENVCHVLGKHLQGQRACWVIGSEWSEIFTEGYSRKLSGIRLNKQATSAFIIYISSHNLRLAIEPPPPPPTVVVIK